MSAWRGHVGQSLTLGRATVHVQPGHFQQDGAEEHVVANIKMPDAHTAKHQATAFVDLAKAMPRTSAVRGSNGEMINSNM